MSNDPFKLARLAGYYKGVQSAGAAVSFGMDAVKVCPSLHLSRTFLMVPRVDQVFDRTPGLMGDAPRLTPTLLLRPLPHSRDKLRSGEGHPCRGSWKRSDPWSGSTQGTSYRWSTGHGDRKSRGEERDRSWWDCQCCMRLYGVFGWRIG